MEEKEHTKETHAPHEDAESRIIQERKKKLVQLFKKDRLFSVFAAIALLSFLFSLLTRAGIGGTIGAFTPLIWIVLAILAGFSAIFVHYKKPQFSFYPLLGWIVFLAVSIRTRNLDGLRDITTNTWTLGPDLDPFLFLRWAKSIVANGTLMALDTMRNVPLGFETKGELILHPYLIAWFHNVAVLFGSESVTQSAAVYPAFMFALTVIAFFLLVRELFVVRLGNTQASVIAIVSSFFLSVLPALLPRTIAGIPEKESAAFVFMFLSFYFFMLAWKSDRKYGKYVLSLISGITTAAMALIWGGFIYIYITLFLAVLIAFVLNQITRDKFIIYAVWLVSSVLIMSQFSSRYTLLNLATSTTTGIAFALFFVLLIHFILFNTKLRSYLVREKIQKIPRPVISIIISFVLVLVFAVIFLGPGFLVDSVNSIFTQLVKPVTGRIGVTVAENRQPYFGEWSNSFGPIVQGTPVFFWLFFIGSIVLFAHIVRSFKPKEKALMIFGYALFLVGLVFSRYNRNGLLNGENAASLILYFGTLAVFIGILGFYYYRYYHKDISLLKEIDFGFIFVFAFFFLSIVSARGAVRLIMVLVPSASIIASYFAVMVVSHASRVKKDTVLKLLGWVVAGAVILSIIFAGFQFYLISNASAQQYVPAPYNQQWQQAMSWVRENTAEDAVFGHWWDYGYWLQSIGERATVLDGGNAIAYWNHFMGRHALTGPSTDDALAFLYSHNTTHFLIDSTDIGKYTAFSGIGSNESYDRRSWIGTFQRDNNQIFEAKNRTLYIYSGGFSLDEDIIYESSDGTTIFLPGVGDRDINAPGAVAGLAAIRVEIDELQNVLQPTGIFVYQGAQYEIPLRYAYANGARADFGSGIEAGIFLLPRVTQDHAGIRLENNAALLYLSKRTVNSQLARLYLYDETGEHFTLAHTQDDPVIANLKSQGAAINDFVYFQGFRGPIKIWEISYPDNVVFNEDFIETIYPEELRRV